MRLDINVANPSDDAAIRGLLRREPIPGQIRVTYEREPEFWLGCEVAGESCQVLVARPEGSCEIVGLACRSTRTMFLNGGQQRLGYLGQLRIDPRFRGRWLVSRGFSRLKELHDRDPLAGYLAAIVDGNGEATGVLVRNRRQIFPAFHAVADLQTLGITLHRAKPLLAVEVNISAPEEKELPELSCFLQRNGANRQFFPVWTEDGLRDLFRFGLRIDDLRVARRDGRVVGMAGIWDQSSFKQTIVQGYSGWLKAFAPLYNVVAPWFGRGLLPRPGEKLKSAYAVLICVENDEVCVFRPLLRELYNLARTCCYNYLLIGFDSRDPLLPAALDYAHVAYRSRLYLAEWSDGGCLYEQLDKRPVYADIANL